MKRIVLILTLLFSTPLVWAQGTTGPALNLNTPAQGNTNWAGLVNSNWTVINAAVSQLEAPSFQGAWSSAVTYATNQIVSFNSGTYISLQGGNFNQNPSTSALFWQSIGSSGSSFTNIGSGTNSSATMLVGTGASLSYTGTGTINASSVDGVLVTGTPAASYVIVANSASAGIFRRLTQDDILPGFAINSFSGGSTVEIGASVINPTFTASYSSTPTSAQITNTDSINSPLNLTTPFTSASVTGTFVHTTTAITTFTLTAISTSTQTRTTSLQWQPRVFGGVGAAGATSTVTASGSTAVLSNSSVLASLGLTTNSAGSTYGPFTAASQKVYLLLQGGSHTFKDAATGFSFAFNTPTAVSFVNQNGSTVSMFLYESTNTLTGTFNILVVS